MKKKIIFCFVFFAVLKISVQFPTGAPISRCFSLEPSHQGNVGQGGSAPYEIIPHENQVKGGTKLRVELRTVDPRVTFRGFMMNARVRTDVVEDQTILGQFQLVEGLAFNFRDCSGPRDTVTNADNDEKTSLVFEWTAPRGFSGHVRFHATFVLNFVTFWVNQMSTEVEILLSDTDEEPPTIPPIDGVDVYEGCDETKTCFGIGPGDCVRNRRCDTIGAVIYRDDKFIFEMRSSRGANFVAFAVSNDNVMGADSAIECVNEGGQVRAYSSWTRGEPYMDAPRIDSTSIISLVYSRFENGIIYCQVERAADTTIEGVNFNLLEEKYYLLLASGTQVKSDSIAMHDINQDSSEERFLLTDVSVVTGRSRVMLYLHASFMIVSWIGLASIGIFSARFLKKTYVGTTICGKDVWFMVHQISMCLTWLLTFAGFVIIIVDSNRWTTNAHSVLGTIAFSLCLIQPVAAVFRPGPKDSNRPIFNFLHMSAGNVGHLLAIATIFFAATKSRAQLPDYFIYVMIGFAAFYAATYLVMTVLGIMSSTRDTDSLDEGLIKKQGSDAPFSLFLKTTFYFFVLVVCSFAVGLVLIVFSNSL